MVILALSTIFSTIFSTVFSPVRYTGQALPTDEAISVPRAPGVRYILSIILTTTYCLGPTVPGLCNLCHFVIYQD
ncbi:uncharacterized protein F4817DRAFT_339845 [Daldinia loculata]|uniref:uncharacterized protein n=1 Tax=Daldinia loculata TaxID=103429 RepID=UPI0020C4E6B2|nr:uncharacterized protein F4817DRAFT_339845 [Daldinia loculata]KAI1646646.1 hypothetical protein F4817DRAFT_339845 [Daldinia loculata]